MNYFVIASCLISFILVLIPLPFHLKMKNTPTCIYIFWLALASSNQFINAVIWNGNTVDLAPVFCDISSRILVAVNVAIPAASLCIIRHLFNVLSLRAMQWSEAQKRSEFYINLAIGMGIPILSIPSFYIVQTSRYDIYEDIGCEEENSKAALSILFKSGWPLFVGLVTAVYCVLMLRHCAKNYVEVRLYLKTADTKQYIRLAILAWINIIATISLSLWIIVVDVQPENIGPWLGWTAEHAGMDETWVVLYEQWNSCLSQAARWFTPMCAFMFFGFFGFSDEVWAGYGRSFRAASSKVHSWASWVRRTPERAEQPVLPIESGKGPSDLPMYHTSQPTRHNLASTFLPAFSFAPFDSTISQEEKYPWVSTSSTGSLSVGSLSWDEYLAHRDLPSHPATTYHFSPLDDSTQSLSYTLGQIPHI
ncbi:STE3-domain-containing protein [Athelia psychrophila]|uniref:STE3-domain-containing protein n=1 Tax=Athelia psychrophila TaxID=1759441 RepID=A0A166DXF6_9AGAM|nr:STE3-domain-containing protein [Fibularhizoctonia sp. CBS 109695]